MYIVFKDSGTTKRIVSRKEGFRVLSSPVFFFFFFFFFFFVVFFFFFL